MITDDPGPDELVHSSAATAVALTDLLGAIQEFGTASVELIAWEFCTTVEALEPTWQDAIDRDLIESTGLCCQTGETMYGLRDR
jgi:hypothetical protein